MIDLQDATVDHRGFSNDSVNEWFVGLVEAFASGVTHLFFLLSSFYFTMWSTYSLSLKFDHTQVLTSDLSLSLSLSLYSIVLFVVVK